MEINLKMILVDAIVKVHAALKIYNTNSQYSQKNNLKTKSIKSELKKKRSTKNQKSTMDPESNPCAVFDIKIIPEGRAPKESIPFVAKIRKFSAIMKAIKMQQKLDAKL